MNTRTSSRPVWNNQFHAAQFDIFCCYRHCHRQGNSSNQHPDSDTFVVRVLHGLSPFNIDYLEHGLLDEGLGRVLSGQSPESCTRHQPGTACIVMIEESPHDFPGRIEASNGLIVRVHDLTAG